MKLHILENSEWKITISTVGAELISAVRKSDGREFIWNAQPDIWKRHAPILFPLVGKYKNNTCTFEGREYRMTQHGFARDMDFVVDGGDGTAVTMSLCESEESLEKYPFGFRLSVKYSLENNILTVGWTVENTNGSEMYFSIGGHPAFVGKNSSLTGAQLAFETDKDELVYEILNSDGLLSSETDTLRLTDKKAVITESFFDRDALIFEHTDCRSISLVEDGEKVVTVNFDFPLFGIWSACGKNNRFVCIEPWCGRADRASFDGELQDREYINKLEKGGVFKKEYTIAFGS